jgi:hypothetical protein
MGDSDLWEWDLDQLFEKPKGYEKRWKWYEQLEKDEKEKENGNN